MFHICLSSYSEYHPSGKKNLIHIMNRKYTKIWFIWWNQFMWNYHHMNKKICKTIYSQHFTEKNVQKNIILSIFTGLHEIFCFHNPISSSRTNKKSLQIYIYIYIYIYIWEVSNTNQWIPTNYVNQSKLLILSKKYFISFYFLI